MWDCDWALQAALDGNVALNETPLYSQRMNTEGYSSGATRKMEQILSSIEIRERLAAMLAAKDAATQALRHDFKRSAGQHWLNLAYQLRLQGGACAAFKVWMASQQLTPQPAASNSFCAFCSLI